MVFLEGRLALITHGQSLAAANSTVTATVTADGMRPAAFSWTHTTSSGS